MTATPLLASTSRGCNDVIWGLPNCRPYRQLMKFGLPGAVLALLMGCASTPQRDSSRPVAIPASTTQAGQTAPGPTSAPATPVIPAPVPVGVPAGASPASDAEVAALVPVTPDLSEPD